MNSNPFFSVVIPVYNRASIIQKTVSSVLNQQFKDFEIILVDDGSTDSTADEIKTTFGNNSRVKLIRQPNRERGASRNTGLKNASGKYIIFFDSDDIMHDNHLNVLHEKINQLKFPFFIATKFDFTDETGARKTSDIQSLKEGFYDYRLFLNGNPLACNVCVFAGNPELCLFEEDRNYAIKEDWMFLIQNTKKHPLFIVDAVTLSMTDHAGRSMRTDNKLIIERTQAAGKWIKQKISLTAAEQKQLDAHINYFCGIHSYLDHERKESILYSLHAMKSGGVKIKYLILFLKSIVGKKIISKIR